MAEDLDDSVLIAPADFGWLYQPYDGGADVRLPNAGEREQMRSRHRDWLSALPSGL